MENSDIRQSLEALLQQVGGKTERIKVTEVRERYIREKGRVAKGTLKNYRYFFDRVQEKMELWPTTAGEVNEFLSSLTGLSDASVGLMFRQFRAVGRHMKKTYGWLDPSENCVRPKVAHKRRRYFSPDELRAIGGACSNVRDKALVMLCFDSAARIGEIAELRESDLGVDSIKVKGKTGERRYRCDTRIISLLKECAVEGIVFPQLERNGEVVRPIRCAGAHALAKRVHNVMVRGGIEGKKIGPHTLRHTAASVVAKSTMSALAVKAILQHDDIATSMVYIHDADDKIQQEISPLELSGMQISGQAKQLGMGDRSMLPSGGTAVESPVADMVDGLFPEIRDGVKIRPQLDSDDLRLIQDGLKSLMRSRHEDGAASESVQLIRRMLRKVS